MSGFSVRELNVLFECVQTEREAQEAAIKDGLVDNEFGIDSLYAKELIALEAKLKEL